MKYRQRAIALFACFFSFFSSFSQSAAADANLGKLSGSLQTAGISAATTQKIKDLVNLRNKNLASYQQEQQAQNEGYPIAFTNPEATEKFHHQQFIKSLGKLLSLDQFKKLFLPQLQYRIERAASNRLAVLKKQYGLTAEQETSLKKLLTNNATNEIAIQEYYNYDDTVAKDSHAEEQLKSVKKEMELLQSFGYYYANRPGTKLFIEKLKAIHLEPTKINQLVKAMHLRDEKKFLHDKNWRVNDTTSVIHFHDEGDVEFAFDMEFRELVSKSVTIEEFKTLFLPQFANRIQRETLKETKATATTFNLNEAQFAEIQTLIKEKITEKVLTEEYYKYSYYLYEQKLRAVEYRHEKNIKETLQKFATN